MQTTREGVGVEGCSHPESRTSLPVSYLFIYVGCAENQTQSLMPARQAVYTLICILNLLLARFLRSHRSPRTDYKDNTIY